MSDTNTNQKGNTVGGHLAGRDVNTTVNNFASKKSCMASLIEQYKKEVEQNQSLKDFIDLLQHYLVNVDGGTIIGLEEKLKAGGRESEVDEAVRLKELFYKKMTKNQFSEAAQTIMAFILGEMHQMYKAYILPMIQQKSSKSDVDKAILEKIINPLFEKLEENVLRISTKELEGMLYFLTGNCHIRWN